MKCGQVLVAKDVVMVRQIQSQVSLAYVLPIKTQEQSYHQEVKPADQLQDYQ
jgi:hypothetical protein